MHRVRRAGCKQSSDQSSLQTARQIRYWKLQPTLPLEKRSRALCDRPKRDFDNLQKTSARYSGLPNVVTTNSSTSVRLTPKYSVGLVQVSTKSPKPGSRRCTRTTGHA